MTRTPDDETLHPRPSTSDRVIARRLDVLLPPTDTPGGNARRLIAEHLVDVLHVRPDRAARTAEALTAELLDLLRAADDEPAPPPADPDQACTHPGFEALVMVGRIVEGDSDNPTPGMPRAYMAEVTVKCAACGESFKFDGIPYGLSYAAPTVSIDGRELRAPIYPMSSPPNGRRGGGFDVRLIEPS